MVEWYIINHLLFRKCCLHFTSAALHSSALQIIFHRDSESIGSNLFLVHIVNIGYRKNILTTDVLTDGKTDGFDKKLTGIHTYARVRASVNICACVRVSERAFIIPSMRTSI